MPAVLSAWLVPAAPGTAADQRPVDVTLHASGAGGSTGLPGEQGREMLGWIGDVCPGHDWGHSPAADGGHTQLCGASVHLQSGLWWGGAGGPAWAMFLAHGQLPKAGPSRAPLWELLQPCTDGTL